LKPFAVIISTIIFAAWGIWLYRHAECDPWTLLGATALVARMGCYHRSYDDGLVFLAVIALHRLWRQGSPSAGWLLVGVTCSLELPIPMVYQPDLLMATVHAFMGIMWLAALFFLMAKPDRPPSSSVE
jgi:hypothetical protein